LGIIRWLARRGGLALRTPPPRARFEREADPVVRGRALRGWLASFSREDLATLTVVELARRFGCSTRHLARLFSAEFGMPVRRHQIALRMESARELLRDERLRVADVARRSGYRSLGLFNATFKAWNGVTPGVWRRSEQSGRRPVPQVASSSSSAAAWANRVPPRASPDAEPVTSASCDL
jgi:AraC-like DNA-binding protein